ncbi:MarR family winged helix-turn-helix transcriptional regulator [Sungkyunkwania multivorans]|uniref:MarR family winged helix-turn-helix transcriptional regulator n=1 Tax=Sungkyunkwania multivorans TaxID=1173618 RepID=A0ABW3D0T2_9FLAO
MTIEEAIKATKPMDIHTKTIINLMYTSNFVVDKITEVLKEYDLSMQQYNVLRILRGQRGKPANLSTIQERMVNRMSNTTRLVDKLIAKKLVNRITCPTNRRKVEITITKNGLELLNTLEIIEGLNKQMLTDLSREEMETLNTLLDKLKQ